MTEINFLIDDPLADFVQDFFLDDKMVESRILIYY